MRIRTLHASPRGGCGQGDWNAAPPRLLARQVAPRRRQPRGGQSAQAIGRKKGGINTKLAALVDARGCAVALSVALGQRRDLMAVEPLLPFLRRRRVVADKGFDPNCLRSRLRQQGTRLYIPPRRNRKRRALFQRGCYRRRHHVENFFCRFKGHRRISTRYDKLVQTYLGFVQLAAVFDWLTHRV